MAPDYPILLVVAAALIDGEGRVLLQQRAPHRSMPGLWEFPGGKVESGETPEAALARELEEELGVGVAPGAMTPVAFASDTLDERHLVLLLYMAREWAGEPHPLDASAIRWVDIEDMKGLPMPPADVPLVAALEWLIPLRA
ncbi:NUDIX domain-containing protein [Sphingomonas sp. MAH-20]|uniref:8-oxo-dGTP diphosphatase n=1 Tax=Sphingomonas horti TaxID=2682842 RepID=A0A6I4J0B1_9SPHN|nr:MULTISPECIES: (deoxy)nucleoside triphosphate pyrophosphohydrolase [Sphingomonas]MBA2919996.1 (deoxy)nucleoside triphosphate pyrophosphohydrolase [Sphingomonas sp. CGMCC 1.13658]MVO77877.1 NUDIX domain-containing protein [Sphingomonas horti]